MSVFARSVVEQLDDLVIVPDPFQHTAAAIEKAAVWSGMIAAHSADNECVHGRLAGDRTAPCGCFPGELA